MKATRTTAGGGTERHSASRTSARVFLLFSLVLLAADAPAASGSGSPVTSLASLTIEWSVQFRGQPAAPPAYDAAQAYVALRSGVLVAISLESGRERWNVERSTTGGLAAGEGLVFVPGEHAIHALDAADGTERWRTAIEGALSAPLAWDGGWLFACTQDGDVLAMRAADGQTIWRRRLDAAPRIPPSAVGDRLYVPLDDGRLLALALLTGNSLWERTLGGTPGRILALEDRVYVGSRDKFLYCLSPADGSTRWRWRAGAELIGQAVVDPVRVFFTARDNTVRALDRRSGNQRWKRALTLRPSAAPVPFADVIVVSGLAAELRGFRASDGTPAGVFAAPADVAAAPHAADVPRLGGPVLILLIGDGRLVAVRPAIDPVLQPPAEAIPGEPAPNDGPLEPPPVPLDWMPGAPLPPESEIPPHRVSGPGPNLPQEPL